MILMELQNMIIMPSNLMSNSCHLLFQYHFMKIKLSPQQLNSIPSLRQPSRKATTSLSSLYNFDSLRNSHTFHGGQIIMWILKITGCKALYSKSIAGRGVARLISWLGTARPVDCFNKSV